jgi:hypothetical protein
MKAAPAALPVKGRMLGTLGKPVITPMGFLVTGCSVMGREGRLWEEEITNTMGFTTVGILAEIMDAMVTIMPARFPANNHSNARVGHSNGRYAAIASGLTEFQQRMVTEAAETFARQLAERLELLQPAGQQYVPKQPAPHAPPVSTVVRQLGLVRPSPAPAQNGGTGQG